jgi:hypothetical protein
MNIFVFQTVKKEGAHAFEPSFVYAFKPFLLIFSYASHSHFIGKCEGQFEWPKTIKQSRSPALEVLNHFMEICALV